MKEEALKNLDIICDEVMSESGTLRTHGIDYAYHIRKQIQVCDKLGCTRTEIQAILTKYTNEITIKLPTPFKRRKHD